jgi:hypothetical protein
MTIERGFEKYSPSSAGGEGEEGDERQVEEVEPDQRPVHARELGEEGVVRQPVAADHREADEEADELLSLAVELIGELVDAAVVVENGYGEVDDEERDRNREQSIGERQGPVELDAVAVVRWAGHR